MSRLNFTIGLPRSGKSTFCRKWREGGKNRVVLSGDSFRQSIYGERFRIEGELFVRATLLAAVKALVRDGYEILIDETNTSVYHIEEILHVDKNAHAYVFYTSAEVCKERAIDCNQLDLLTSIDRMDRNLFQTLPLIKNGTIKLSHTDIGKSDRWNERLGD